MTDEELQRLHEKSGELVKGWGLHLDQLLRTLSAEIERGESTNAPEFIVELWENVSAALMFLMLAHYIRLRTADDSAVRGIVLRQEDSDLIRSEGLIVLSDVAAVAEAMDRGHSLACAPATTTLALRLAGRAYIAREFFSSVFKDAQARQIVGESPMMKPAITALHTLPARWLHTGGDLTTKTEQFIASWPVLLEKTAQGPRL